MFTKKHLHIGLLALSLSVISQSAFAVDLPGLGGNPIGDVLCQVVGWFYGSVGAGIATLAVIIIGLGALLQKVSWGMAIIVGVGIATMFGAPMLLISMGASPTVLACAAGGFAGNIIGGITNTVGGLTSNNPVNSLSTLSGLMQPGGLNGVTGTVTGGATSMGSQNMNLFNQQGQLIFSGAVPLATAAQIPGSTAGTTGAGNLSGLNGSTTGLTGSGVGGTVGALTGNGQLGQTVGNVFNGVTGNNSTTNALGAVGTSTGLLTP